MKYIAANTLETCLLQPVAMKFDKCVQNLLGTGKKL